MGPRQSQQMIPENNPCAPPIARELFGDLKPGAGLYVYVAETHYEPAVPRGATERSRGRPRRHCLIRYLLLIPAYPVHRLTARHRPPFSYKSYSVTKGVFTVAFLS